MVMMLYGFNAALTAMEPACAFRCDMALCGRGVFPRFVVVRSRSGWVCVSYSYLLTVFRIVRNYFLSNLGVNI